MDLSESTHHERLSLSLQFLATVRRKRKGGTKREKIKKRKALATDTAKCCKISNVKIRNVQQ